MVCGDATQKEQMSFGSLSHQYPDFRCAIAAYIISHGNLAQPTGKIYQSGLLHICDLNMQAPVEWFSDEGVKSSGKSLPTTISICNSSLLSFAYVGFTLSPLDGGALQSATAISMIVVWGGLWLRLLPYNRVYPYISHAVRTGKRWEGFHCGFAHKQHRKTWGIGYDWFRRIGQSLQSDDYFISCTAHYQTFFWPIIPASSVLVEE